MKKSCFVYIVSVLFVMGVVFWFSPPDVDEDPATQELRRAGADIPTEETVSVTSTEEQQVAATSSFVGPEETDADPGFHYQTFDFAYGDRTGTMHVLKLDPAHFAGEIVHDQTAPKGISSWMSGSHEVLLNGAYFHEDFSPSGYLMVDGKRIGQRLFDQDRSGLVVIDADGRLSIRDLATDPIAIGASFAYALQSYPFLIKAGIPAVKEDTQKHARRSAIGVGHDGSVYIIVSPSFSLSLFEFAEELEKTGIPFASVLNLDGGPSTGLSVRLPGFQKTISTYSEVPNVLRFRIKQSKQ